MSEGDSRSEVAAKCGEPTDVITLRSVFRRPSSGAMAGRTYIGEDFIEVPVESWIYNLGPNKLMRRSDSRAASSPRSRRWATATTK